MFGCMLASGWLRDSLRYSDGLNTTVNFKGHIEKLELNDTEKLIV
jgi:hypothetical protein